MKKILDELYKFKNQFEVEIRQLESEINVISSTNDYEGGRFVG